MREKTNRLTGKVYFSDPAYNITMTANEIEKQYRFKKEQRIRGIVNEEKKNNKPFEEKIAIDIENGETEVKIFNKYIDDYTKVFPEFDENEAKTELERLIRQANYNLIKKMRQRVKEEDDLKLEIMYLIAIGKEEAIAQILSAIFEKDKINSDSISGIKQTMEELYELLCKENFFCKDGKLYKATVVSKLSDLLQFDDRFKILDRSGCKTSIPNVGAIPNGIEILYGYIKMRYDTDKEKEETKQKGFRKSKKVPRSRWSQYR